MLTTLLRASTAARSYSAAVSRRNRSTAAAAAARLESTELPTRSSNAFAARMMRLLSGGAVAGTAGRAGSLCLRTMSATEPSTFAC
jgi:hypothetical protein